MYQNDNIRALAFFQIITFFSSFVALTALRRETEITATVKLGWRRYQQLMFAAAVYHRNGYIGKDFPLENGITSPIGILFIFSFELNFPIQTNSLPQTVETIWVGHRALVLL